MENTSDESPPYMTLANGISTVLTTTSMKLYDACIVAMLCTQLLNKWIQFCSREEVKPLCITTKESVLVEVVSYALPENLVKGFVSDNLSWAKEELKRELASVLG